MHSSILFLHPNFSMIWLSTKYICQRPGAFGEVTDLNKRKVCKLYCFCTPVQGVVFIALVVFGIVTVFRIETKTVGDIASIKGGFPPPLFIFHSCHRSLKQNYRMLSESWVRDSTKTFDPRL